MDDIVQAGETEGHFQKNVVYEALKRLSGVA
jgi:hypothetical protein